MRESLPFTTPNRGGWLQRAFFAVTAAGLVVVAFFFLTVALLAAAMLAAFIAVRWWWLVRKLKLKAANEGPVEGEYTIVERERVEYRGKDSSPGGR